MCAQENCQTTELCQRLGINNPFCPVSCHEAQASRNPDEIDLDSNESEAENSTNPVDTEQKTSDEATPNSGRTEEGVVWSIQRRPGLNLPAPSTVDDSHVTADDSHVTADEDHVTAVQTNKYGQVHDIAEEKASEFESESAVDSDGDGSEQQCSSSKPAIKRRNQEMYTLDEEVAAD